MRGETAEGLRGVWRVRGECEAASEKRGAAVVYFPEGPGGRGVCAADGVADVGLRSQLRRRTGLKVRSTCNPLLYTSTSGSFSAASTPIFASKW